MNKPVHNRPEHVASRGSAMELETRRAGFTLIELLVVVGMLALLSLTLLPSLARTRPETRTSRCLNNLRQLSSATMIYIADNRDCFPGPGSRNTYGFHIEDWIYWRTGIPQAPLEKSPIIVGFSSSATNWFRCPADWDDLYRKLAGAPYYMASYSMTSYGVNIGMTSIIDYQAYVFKLSQVKNPGSKIMLAEEQSSLSPGERWDPAATYVINDGRWMPPWDPLTARHGGMANVSFADGHAATVAPQLGDDVRNSRPDL